jgi:hypothetical protein
MTDERIAAKSLTHSLTLESVPHVCIVRISDKCPKKPVMGLPTKVVNDEGRYHAE